MTSRLTDLDVDSILSTNLPKNKLVLIYVRWSLRPPDRGQPLAAKINLFGRHESIFSPINRDTMVVSGILVACGICKSACPASDS